MYKFDALEKYRSDFRTNSLYQKTEKRGFNMATYEIEKVDGGYRIKNLEFPNTIIFRTSLTKVFTFLRNSIPKEAEKFTVEIKR